MQSALSHVDSRLNWSWKNKTTLGPMKSNSSPSVQTESDPGPVKLSVLDVIVPFDGWAIALLGKRIDIAAVGAHLDQLSPP